MGVGAKFINYSLLDFFKVICCKGVFQGGGRGGNFISFWLQPTSYIHKCQFRHINSKSVFINHLLLQIGTTQISIFWTYITLPI